MQVLELRGRNHLTTFGSGEVAMRTDWNRIVAVSFVNLLMLPAGLAPLVGKDEKPKAADVVARHLDALGTADARAAAKNRPATGPVLAVFRLGGSGPLTGKGVIGSAGTK